jgi:hypothetical protein
VAVGFQYFSIDDFRHEACSIRFLRSILKPCPPTPSRLSIVRTQCARSCARGDRTGFRLRAAIRFCADRFEWNCHRLHRRKVISSRRHRNATSCRVARAFLYNFGIPVHSHLEPRSFNILKMMSTIGTLAFPPMAQDDVISLMRKSLVRRSN